MSCDRLDFVCFLMAALFILLSIVHCISCYANQYFIVI